MVMIGGQYLSGHLVYDVTDPIHPRLVCTISNTAAHLFTGDTFVYLKAVSSRETDVILHSIGSGNESKVASFPYNLTDPNVGVITDEAWTPDGSLLAYIVPEESTENMQVWLYSQGKARLVHNAGLPIGDCICRFGLPQQVLAFSADGLYLAAGWVAGKGSTPLTVIRVSDGSTAYTAADATYYTALWGRTGHTLYLVGSGMQSWSPETGPQGMLGNAWSVMPGISPDGTQAAYTAYSDPSTQDQPRVYTHDLKAGTTRLLVDKLRTQVLFVKDGWVWYLEERACAPDEGCPGSTTPTGKVFAMQLSTGVEQPVTFASGEDPLSMGGPAGYWVFTPGEYWPNS
jgi:WD40 repeat protein